jgi:predicted small secreted protein
LERVFLPSPLVSKDVRKDKTMLRKIIIALTASAIALGATACNTVKGAGEDIESVGQAGSDAIN